MVSPISSCAWWHNPKPQVIDPLEAVKTTAQCLEDGQPVPADAAKLVAAALRKYLAGQYDITGNLGLRPRRGGRHETPVAIARNEERNAAIKHLVELQDGSKTKRCEKVANLLKDPHVDSRVTEADVFGYLVKLHQDFGSELPTSMRQVLRIVDSK